MQTFPKIQSVKPLSNLQLLVTFQNQIKKIYDCSHLLAREHFKPLQDNVLFKTVYVDHGGYGIIWNDPSLNLNWGTENPVLTKRDQKWPTLQQQTNLPVYS